MAVLEWVWDAFWYVFGLFAWLVLLVVGWIAWLYCKLRWGKK